MEIKSTKVLIVGCGQLGFSVAKIIDPHIFKLYGFSRSLKKSPPSIEMHQVDILKTETIDTIKLCKIDDKVMHDIRDNFDINRA